MSLLYSKAEGRATDHPNTEIMKKKGMRPSPKISKKRHRPARDRLWRRRGKSRSEGQPSGIKGISPSVSRIKMWSAVDAEGSMTVEAAIILPLLLFFFMNLLSALEMIRLHGNIQASLWNIGRQMAVYGYAYDKIQGEEDHFSALELGGTLLSDAAVYNGLVHNLGTSYLEESPMMYGAKGLNVLESAFLENDDCIDIKVTYTVSPWLNPFGLFPFRMCNRYYGRAWTGYEIRVDSSGSDRPMEDFVYVTQYGQVYHETLECSYLKRMISAVPLEEALSRRNDSGGKYSLCELCKAATQGNLVYITQDGDRYHNNVRCRALIRNIQVLSRQEAQYRYAPCGRCAGKTM